MFLLLALTPPTQACTTTGPEVSVYTLADEDLPTDAVIRFEMLAFNVDPTEDYDIAVLIDEVEVAGSFTDTASNSSVYQAKREGPFIYGGGESPFV